MTTKQIVLTDMILRNEGGYSAPIPGDKGGETYRGIARNYFPRWDGWKILDQYKPITHNRIINNPVLETKVRNFYVINFYKPLCIECIINSQIAAHLYCHGVNAGLIGAAKLLQKSINIVCSSTIAVDGKVGNITLSYCNGKNADAIANQFIAERERYYRKIATGAKTKFLKGWINRVASTTAIAKTLIAK